ncbi:RILP-like protein 2 [Dama dama]|uniref:RILP-like protein 2 n=1 Tax=Dama dama TaxID=30532 RepID=UPI002A35C705|nr:RILP-like protein 2 [Dama dama]
MQILWLEGPSSAREKLCAFQPLSQAAVETPPPSPWKPGFCGHCYQGAELGGTALPPVCSGSRAGSDHSHSLTSLFLFSPALPSSCPFVSRTVSWGPHSCTGFGVDGAPGVRACEPSGVASTDAPTSRAHPSAALIGRFWATFPRPLARQGPRPSGKFSVPGGSWTFADCEKAAPEAVGVWAAMEEPPLREEEEEEEEDEAGPEGALGKSPLQLTAEDVYDISYVMGRELMALGSDPRVTQLQFKIVRVLEMLETLVNEGNLTVEELRIERDNLRKEVEGLRREGSAAGPEVDLGPDKMVVDLTDPNRPRFTLQELRDVLQERNKLKSQLLVVQEELQCYKSGLIPPREGPGRRREKETLVPMGSNANSNKEEKTIIRKLFSFRSGK